MTVENQNQGQPSQAQGQSQAFSIPAEYQSKGWVEKIDSYDALWKTLDNTQSLIGKRPAGIPAEGASEEEFNKFYQAWGRPEAADKYQIESKFEGLPENFDLAPYEGMAKEIAYELGLNQKQAQRLWERYMEKELGGYKTHQEKSQEEKANLDKQFDEIVGKLWGDKYEDVSKNAINFLGASIPPELKEYVPAIAESPQALAIMVSVAEKAQREISAIKQKYGAEDNLKTGVQSGSMSEQEVVQKLTEANLKAKNAAPFSPERKSAEEEAEKLRGMLAKFYK